MKKFCESLIEPAIDIINFKKQKKVTNKCEEKHTKDKNYH